jgi:hypothetical protein
MKPTSYSERSRSVEIRQSLERVEKRIGERTVGVLSASLASTLKDVPSTCGGTHRSFVQEAGLAYARLARKQEDRWCVTGHKPADLRELLRAACDETARGSRTTVFSGGS